MFKSLDEHPLFKLRSTKFDASQLDFNNNNIFARNNLTPTPRQEDRATKIQKFQNTKNVFESRENTHLNQKPAVPVKPRKLQFNLSTETILNNQSFNETNENIEPTISNQVNQSSCLKYPSDTDDASQVTSQESINCETTIETTHFNENNKSDSSEEQRSPPAIKQRSSSATCVNGNGLDHSFETTSSNETSSSTYLHDEITNENNENHAYVNENLPNDKQLSMDGYLLPVEREEPVAPFPFPRGNFIRLRTDFNADDVFDNVTVDSPGIQLTNNFHSYNNEINDPFFVST